MRSRQRGGKQQSIRASAHERFPDLLQCDSCSLHACQFEPLQLETLYDVSAVGQHAQPYTHRGKRCSLHAGEQGRMVQYRCDATSCHEVCGRRRRPSRRTRGSRSNLETGSRKGAKLPVFVVICLLSFSSAPPWGDVRAHHFETRSIECENTIEPWYLALSELGEADIYGSWHRNRELLSSRQFNRYVRAQRMYELMQIDYRKACGEFIHTEGPMQYTHPMEGLDYARERFK